MAKLGVGVTSDETTAAIQIDSTTQGGLPAPRLTTAQRDAIASPATGLFIYNTSTNQYNFYNGSSWVVVASGSTGDVTGPGSATDNAIARFDGTGGKTIQNSAPTIDDSGNMNLADAQLQRPEIRDYAETNTTADSGVNYTINLETGNVFNVQLTGNCAFAFSNPPASGKAGSFTLLLRQGTGSTVYSVTWPTGTVRWPGGSVPTLSTGTNDIDILTFMTIDAGSIWYGFLAGADFS